MTKPASDSKLGALHDALATIIAAQVKELIQEEDEDGNVIREYYSATPALLTVAARFLKDNNITCSVEDSKGLSELTDELASRRKRKDNLKNISFLAEADA